MKKPAMHSIKDLSEATKPNQIQEAKPRTGTGDKAKQTVFFPRPVHRYLARLAVERGTSQQQLITEAVDSWLSREHGTTYAAIIEQDAEAKS